MQRFEIELPNPKQRIYRIIARLIAAMNILSFLLVAFQGESKLTLLTALAGGIIHLFLLIMLFRNKVNFANQILQPGWFFLLSAFLWMILSGYWLAISMFAFALADFINTRKKRVLVNEEGLLYPSFPPKTYNWSSIYSLLLKDDVLSMDLEGNRFLQFALPEENLKHIDTDSFNEYCQKKIAEAAVAEH